MSPNSSQTSEKQIPDWLLRSLPANAEVGGKLEKQISKLADELPGSIRAIRNLLGRHQQSNSYDAMVNVSNRAVWLNLESLYQTQETDLVNLIVYTSLHMPRQGKAKIFRRLAKHPNSKIRRWAHKYAMSSRLHEVALPLGEDEEWNPSGWFFKALPERGVRIRDNRNKLLGRYELPKIETIAELRELLKIKSEKQLGYLLLATDANDGPYMKFTVPKRDGTKREICAPNGPLRWVQRRILNNILQKVTPHPAAHGFIPGRSTVTNAQPHIGSELILKFDLKDFFPTIHIHRIIGLFSSLGYAMENVRFQSHDTSRQIAPTLARLCAYTTDPKIWGAGRMPQGAPTSPAISNLVCRRMDARLEGLVKERKGTYTRYADDLTFSFKHNDLNIGRFRWWVDQICHQEGFEIRHSKDRTIRRSQRQMVTGLVVNDELRVPRKQRRIFRAMLHNCQRDGIESQARGNPDFISYLQGFASYLLMVHPEEGREAMEIVNRLQGNES